MAARIRHIALCVKDIKATADFYEKAFGLKRTPIREGATAWNCYMSDGEINLALLQYKSEVGSGVPKGFVGIHHFGFQCDDLPAQQKKVEAAGGEFFFDLGQSAGGTDCFHSLHARNFGCGRSVRARTGK